MAPPMSVKIRAYSAALAAFCSNSKLVNRRQSKVCRPQSTTPLIKKVSGPAVKPARPVSLT